MNRFTQQDYRAFERQVRAHQHRVYGLACYLLNDRDAAADVTQDVLLRLWRHQRDVDEDLALYWLLRVTRNACIDAIRKRNTERSLMDVDTTRMEAAPSPSRSPSELAESSELRRHVERAVARLNEPFRSIVILREMQGMKYEEICGAMNLPLTTVKVYLHRGRKMLRNYLGQVTRHEHAES